jgi:hypothetical protein
LGGIGIKKITSICIVIILILICFDISILGEKINNSNLEQSDFPTAITVSDSNPFYSLIATPLAIRYDEEINQHLIPLYIKNISDPSRAIERVEKQIGIYSDFIISDIFSPKEISIDIADMFWESSDKVLLIHNSLEGYNLGVAAAPIASYENIPIIVTDIVDSNILNTLKNLNVTYSYVCGDLEGYGNTEKFESIDEIINKTIEIVEHKFGSTNYITVTNPSDIIRQKVIDTTNYVFNGEIFSMNTLPSISINKLIYLINGGNNDVLHEFEIPDDYEYCKINIEVINKDSDDIDETGSKIIVNIYDPNDEPMELFCFSTQAGIPIRDSNGKILQDRVCWETVVYNLSGIYKLKLLGSFITEFSQDYTIKVKLEKLENAKFSKMKGLSSLAPYLTAKNKGVILAKPEFMFVCDKNIITEQPPGVVYPSSNTKLINKSNIHTFKIHNQLNQVLANVADIQLNDTKDLAELREHYANNPINIALLGDTIMLPHYYYPQLDWYTEYCYHFGYDTASDFIYGDIDPVPRNDSITIFTENLFSEYPFQENIVGRIIGWDTQDVSALIIRTFFYNELIENLDNWKVSSTVQTGVGLEAQRLPILDYFIRKGTTDKYKLYAIRWPTGETHFNNLKISEIFNKGAFNVKRTEYFDSMLKGFDLNTLKKIKNQGTLNKIFFPYLRVKTILSNSRIKGGLNQENSNFFYLAAHGSPFGSMTVPMEMMNLGFRSVVFYTLINRIFSKLPRLGIPIFASGLHEIGNYCVRSIDNMEFGPSVVFFDGCAFGRIDNHEPKNLISTVYIHSGINTFIGASTLSEGVGYLDARKRPICSGIGEYIRTKLNPNLHNLHFGRLIASNFFKDIIEFNNSVGLAFRNSRNDYLPMDINSTFFEGFLCGPPKECHYCTLFEHNLFGDPSFNPYEPSNRGKNDL